MSGRITVIGSANVDYIIQLPRLPQKGESVSGGPFSQAFGGKGSNQAMAAWRAGADVSAVFNLGGDANARELLETYQGEGLDVTQVAINPGAVCGVGIILVDVNGDNAIATYPGANAGLSAERIANAEDSIAGSALIMLQMEIPDEAIEKAIETAVRHGIGVMLNFAPARPSSICLDSRVSILVVNETEAETLSGLPATTPETAAKAAEKLAENGHRQVIVTLGAKGVVLREDGRTLHVPAFAVAAVDATAAGDAFCGALAAALVEGRSMPEALTFASAAGALCAGRMGALPSLPRRGEIEAFLAERTG